MGISRYIAFFLFLLLFLTNCKEPENKVKYRIGISQCCDDPWRDVMNAEMFRELSMHPEVGYVFKIAKSESSTQIEQIREMVEDGIDLLIVSPNEARPLTPIIDEMYKSGIPVVLVDRKTESDNYSTFVGADNYEVGETAGKYIGNLFEGKGKILEIQLNMGISPARERSNGFRDAIKRYPDMQLVGVMEDKDYNEEERYRQFSQLLNLHPEATIVFGHTDYLAEQAYKIAADNGRAGDLFFLGIDGIPGTGRGIHAVEAGVLNASMLYPTGGSEAVQLALAILNNLSYSKKNDLQTVVITSDNARILQNQMNKVDNLQQRIDKQLKGISDLRVIYRNQKFYILILLSSFLLTAVFGFFMLLTLRKKQQANKILEIKNKEILENEERILEMSDTIKKTTQAKVDFFTNLSHEFRTPLTLIIGFAEDLLPSKKLSVEMQEGIGQIKTNAFRLLRLINQLMDFRKTESGQMVLRASYTDLIPFVGNIVESYRKVAIKRGMDLQFVARPESLMVWFDINMIDKVIFNLLSNAFNFTPDKGRIYVSISQDKFENCVKIKVEDSGKGMSASEALHVFEPFFQVDNKKRVGTGLGLSLSKTLVELHGGQIEVQHTSEKGSVFVVSLLLGEQHLKADQKIKENPVPIIDPEFLLEQEPDHVFEPGFIEDRPSQQILIIDDNDALRSFLWKKLSPFFDILAAADGKEGIQIALEHTPDLIVCDVMLPEVTGIELTRTIKSDLRTSHIPIILLSARSAVEQQVEGALSGADAYITKPFNIQFLFAQIKSLLVNRQMLRETFSNETSSHNSPPSSGAHINPEVFNPIDLDFVKRFVQYVDAHFARQDFQVSDLCTEFHLSRSQLYRKVNALFDESISSYIQNIRLKKAEELLREGNCSIAEVGYRVGYSSPDYFSTVFRAKYGVAPSALRKNQPPLIQD